jgi:hypothetical protein
MAATAVASPTALRIAAADGLELAATSYAGEAGASRGLVLLVPATGVRRRLYHPLAGFLAECGFDALTWDWRGTGESRPCRLRGFHATMTDWATLDLGGVLAWAAGRARGPLLAAARCSAWRRPQLRLAPARRSPPQSPSRRRAATGATGLALSATSTPCSGTWECPS